MASRVDKIYGDAYISVKTDEDDLLEALEEAKAVKEILDSNTDFVNFLNHPQITKEEKMYLERCGYGRKDFAQIQEATRRDKTTLDNLLRPFFLKTGIDASVVTLILSILCGLAAFGPVGVFAGPVLVAVAIQAGNESTLCRKH